MTSPLQLGSRQVLVFAATASREGTVPRPAEPLGVQWGEGQLSCWLEPAGDRGDDLEMSVSPLPPASRTSLGDWGTPCTYQFSGLQVVPEASMRWKV